MAFRPQQFFGVLVSFVLACASGSEVDPMRRRDGSVPPERDGSSPSGECAPACAPGAECIDGRCLTPGVDLDDDGVVAELDCDDGDPSIGTDGSRECVSACGTGTESCVAGIWSTCSAPETCDCTPGSPPRDVSCVRHAAAALRGRHVDQRGHVLGRRRLHARRDRAGDRELRGMRTRDARADPKLQRELLVG